MKNTHECSFCARKFSEKSNLTRHLKVHTEPKSIKCDVCDKTFTLKQNLEQHMRQHMYPVIPLYKQGEARLQCTSAAKEIANLPDRTVDAVWLDSKTAEAAACRTCKDLWRGQLVLSFGKYAGETYKWLFKNDAGWVVWLLHEFQRKGDKNSHMRWQKEQLLELVNMFPSVSTLLENRLKVRYYECYYYYY